MTDSAQISGVIFEVRRFTVHDGPGLRTTVFLQGCPLRCRWCHNPEGMADTPSGVPAVAGSGSGGPRGRVTAAEVVRDIARDTPWHDASGGGATFSGGEPLGQPEFLAAMLRGCRARGISTAVDTSGYAPPEALEAVAGLADLFLYDLKVMDAAAHERHTGVSNALVLRNLARLAELARPVWIRLPLVPGITMEAANLDAMIDFLRPWPALRRVSVLPYHRIATGKYARLGLADPMAGVAPPSDADILGARRRFESAGFRVTVGG